MKDLDSISLSRAMSHALRHEPWLYELELDEAGWVGVADLLIALRLLKTAWLDLQRDDLENVIKSSEKRRYELSGDRIRALYGHSTPNKMLYVKNTPPIVLFHGTSPQSAVAIFEKGLLPIGRQYEHMSVDCETAIEVGRRKGAAPVLLRIDAIAALEGGVLFYSGNEKVWLADFVPPEFIRSEMGTYMDASPTSSTLES